jgi:Universal stress protein family
MSGITLAGGRRVAVVVDGSATSASALRRGASQARQRNALLDVVSILPSDADSRAMVLARVRLGEFTRRECPYGVGTPIRIRVERGDLPVVLAQIADGAELLLTGCPKDRPPEHRLPEAAARPAGRRPLAHPAWWAHVRHA